LLVFMQVRPLRPETGDPGGRACGRAGLDES